MRLCWGTPLRNWCLDERPTNSGIRDGSDQQVQPLRETKARLVRKDPINVHFGEMFAPVVAHRWDSWRCCPTDWLWRSDNWTFLYLKWRVIHRDTKTSGTNTPIVKIWERNWNEGKKRASKSWRREYVCWGNLFELKLPGRIWHSKAFGKLRDLKRIMSNKIGLLGILVGTRRPSLRI